MSSNGWPLSISQRDYRLVTGGGFNGDQATIIDRLNGLSDVNDCAAACDNNSRCKSFAMATKYGSRSCILSSRPDPSGGGWFNGDPSLVMYAQNSRKDQGLTITTKPISATRFDGSGNMFAGRAYDGGDGPVAAGAQFNTNGQNGCHMRYNTDGVATSDTTGNPGGCDHGDCCILNQLGAQACQPAGEVTSAQPVGGSADTKVTCTYKSLDPTWLNNNIQQLGNYFDTKNAGLAGLAWCNNLSVSDLYKNQSKCQSYATASNTDYKVFLGNKLAGSEWYKDTNAAAMLLDTVCSSGSSSVDSMCQSALSAMPSAVPATDIIDLMNSTLGKADQNVVQSISSATEKICDANPTSTKCACYNVLKYTKNDGLAGCTTDTTKVLPGCNDPLIQKAAKLKSLLQDAQGADAATLLAGIGNFEASLLYQVPCSKADLGYLQYKKKDPNYKPPALNACISNFNVSDSTVTGSSFVSRCNVGGSGANDPLPPDDSGPNIPLIAGVGGGSALISSCSCCVLIVVLMLMSR